MLERQNNSCSNSTGVQYGIIDESLWVHRSYFYSRASANHLFVVNENTGFHTRTKKAATNYDLKNITK